MKLRSGKVIKRAPYKKRAYRRNKQAKVSNAIKTYVKKTIAQNMENKVFVTYGKDQSLLTASSTPPQFISLVPSINQGTGQNQRIGNEIKVKSGYVRGFVNLRPYTAITNPLQVPTMIKIWLCCRKRTNQLIAGVPTNTDWNNFFEVGGGSSSNFVGNILDMTQSENKDYWTILGTRTFQLGTSVAGTSVGSGAIVSGAQQVCRSFYFNIGKKMGKLKYNDNTSATCSNKELFLAFQAVFADGSDSTSTTQAEYHYTQRLEYEDA